MFILYKKFCKLSLAIVLFCSYVSYSDQNEANQDFKKYSIIAERNIFSKYKVSAEKENSTGTVTQKMILSLYVLRGISLQGEMGIAFIEEEISGDNLRLKIGDNITGCRIKDIKQDFIVYEKDSQEHTVNIGFELFRTESQTMSSHKSAGLPDKNIKVSGSAEKANSSSSSDDMLKKMLERRKDQISK